MRVCLRVCLHVGRNLRDLSAVAFASTSTSRPLVLFAACQSASASAKSPTLVIPPVPIAAVSRTHERCGSQPLLVRLLCVVRQRPCPSFGAFPAGFASLRGLSSLARLVGPTSMDRAHEARGKRKQPSLPAGERPIKQMRPDPVEAVDMDDVQANGSLEAFESDGDAARLVPIAPMTADSAEWQATIETVVRNVVSIRFCQTCSFDTDPAASSEATGFVVDSEKGYILTNRHVRRQLAAREPPY